jgi:GrpB-like predicted nucleotidyltransferase (UPF0157 family)
MTDQEIREVVVGELRPHDAPIVLVEYDPEWPVLFAREARRIREVLGERVLQLEHVGSTSVPGLIAKNILDILLAVAESSDEPSYVPDLEKAGYRLTVREPEWHQHRLFKGPDTNINLHVFTKGSSEIERTLLLRDWLRENPENRKLYAETKKKLAAHKMALRTELRRKIYHNRSNALTRASLDVRLEKPESPSCGGLRLQPGKATTILGLVAETAWLS